MPSLFGNMSGTASGNGGTKTQTEDTKEANFSCIG